jgi:hypothetical protein
MGIGGGADVDALAAGGVARLRSTADDEARYAACDVRLRHRIGLNSGPSGEGKHNLENF